MGEQAHLCAMTQGSINIGEILKSRSVSFQQISEQNELFLSIFSTTKIMAEPDIQFPTDEGVIPDAQLGQGPAVDQLPPPVDAPAAPPSMASHDTQNDEMEVYYCLHYSFMYVLLNWTSFYIVQNV